MNSKRKIMFLVILIAIGCLAFWMSNFNKTPVLGSAVLSWESNTESDLAGYKVYYGTNPRNSDCPKGGYEEVISIGKKNKYKVDKLEPGKTYYFSITSYNSAKKESCFSEEMKKYIELSIIDKLKNLFSKI